MPNYWIFQTRPDKYDLLSALNVLDVDVWTVPERYARSIRNGDKIFFWKAGGKEGNAGEVTLTLAHFNIYSWTEYEF